MKLLALLALAACVSGQERADVPSPFAIREEALRLDNFDAPALMKRLGLPERLFENGFAFDCAHGSCSAEVLPFEEALVGSQGLYLLNFCQSASTSCRVIAFEGTDLRDGDGEWRVIGFDDVNDKYGASIERNIPWLTIDRWQGSGTGVVSYHRDWFTLTRTEFRKELTTISHGRDMNVNPMRFWRGQMIEGPAHEGPQTVTFLYFIEFRDRASEMKLFDERRLVKFTRQSPGEPYRLDETASELTQSQIDTFFEFDNDIPPAQVIAFARNALLQMARSNDPAKKSWLRHYLARAPFSPIKTQLLRALEPRKR